MNSSDVPPELKMRYVNSFAQKAIEIKSYLMILRKNSDNNVDILKELQLFIHNLKGSSSSYGFNDIGTEACVILKILEKSSPDKPALFTACEKVLQLLETAYASHIQS